ncbi:MAG: DsbA family protein [Alphaproteobacteria bacterium]|nr:DsbA family protein [Alphaproteobacteria bacterium]MDP6566086.1 DsbA family protein [Alphaproteobacteria bacterium]MDP6812912.1 DsbA family protein [Alphaproteobacteria bacterium]
MSLRFDLYYTMRSPYCYLATPFLAELVRDYQVDCDLRPVYPLAVSDPSFFTKVNPLFVSYLAMDTARVAERHGIPYRWPQPDPVVQDLETRKIAEEQPYIQRLTRLAVAAQERGRGLPFVVEVSGMIFGGVDDWHLGDHLAGAVARAGLDLGELDAAIAADPDGYQGVAAENRQSQLAAGHWGAPLMVFEGEPFFGQDRLDLFKWRLEQRGLQPRTG